MTPKAPAAKTKFVAMPIRAGSDERLSSRHWRVLLTVAMHDRMGKNGQGCWASNRRIADLARCEYTRVADALSDLRDFGYITSEINPKNRNYRIHHVVYDDPTTTQSGSGTPSQPGRGLRGLSTAGSAATLCQSAKGQPFANRQTLCPDEANPLPPHCGKSLKSEARPAPKYILQEVYKKDTALVIGEREADCAEAQTSEGREVKEAIAYLANAESLLKCPSERTILRYEITKLIAMADDPGLPEHICERARELLIVARTMQ